MEEIARKEAEIEAKVGAEGEVDTEVLNQEEVPEGASTLIKPKFEYVSDVEEIFKASPKPNEVNNNFLPSTEDVVNLLTPYTTPNEEPVKVNRTFPASSLSLEWVHAYSGFTGSARYTANGDIVYPAGNMAVVHKKADEEAERPAPVQLFQCDQINPISSMAISKNGRMVATGCTSTNTSAPTITIFDTKTDALKTKQIFVGRHSGTISSLDFSANGNYLLSVSTYEGIHSLLVIYDVSSGKAVYSSKLVKEVIFEAKFDIDSYAFGACSTQGVSFWSHMKGNDWKKMKGIGSKKENSLVKVLAPFNKTALFLSGCESGSLAIWECRNCVTLVGNAHSAAVEIIHFSSPDELILSGGKDNKVRIWNTMLTPMYVIDTLAVGLPSTDVTPISVEFATSSNGKKILLGTKGGEIFEIAMEESEEAEDPEASNPVPVWKIASEDGAPIVSSHSKGGIYAVACSPSNPEYASIGGDGILRIWDKDAHSMKTSAAMAGPGYKLDYSPDGSSVAVAIVLKDTSVVPAALATRVDIVSLDSFTTTGTIGSPSDSALISYMKYSPDGALLVTITKTSPNTVAAHKIGSEGTWEQAWTISPFESEECTDFDFASDNSMIKVSNTSASQVVFISSTDGSLLTDSEVIKSASWASSSCPLSLDTYAVSKFLNEQPQIISTLGPVVTALKPSSNQLLMFNSPVDEGSLPNSIEGNASSITSLSFTPENTHMVTVGSTDQSILQWAIEVDDAVDSGDEAEEGEEEDAEEAELDEDGNPIIPPEPESDDEKDPLDGAEINSSFKTSNISNISKNTEGKVNWQSSVVQPQDIEVSSSFSNQPQENLELTWIYGFSADMGYNNVFYNVDGHIVYPASSFIVVFDKVEWNQKHICCHQGENKVTSLAMHPDNIHVASGGSGLYPSICVSNSSTTKTVMSMKFEEEAYGITAMAFSPTGSVLVAAGMDSLHTLYFVNWESGTLRNKVISGPQKVLTLVYSPDGTKLLQGGVDHFSIWNVQGRNASSKVGIFGKSAGAKRSTIVSGCWVGGEAILASSTGQVYTCEGRKVANANAAHKGGVSSIAAFPSPDPEAAAEGAQILITAGKDGIVKVWDGVEMGEASGEYTIPSFQYTTPMPMGIRSFARSSDGRKYLVGTTGGNIIELSTVDGSEMNEQPLVTGSWKRQATGLTTHPVRTEFATVGEDRILRINCMAEKKEINALELPSRGRCVDFAPSGLFLAVGTAGEPIGATLEEGQEVEKGMVLVVSLMEESLRITHKKSDAKGPISCLKFSPNGKMLCVASEDNNMYVYDVLLNFRLRCTLSNTHTTPVVNIDWDTTNKVIASLDASGITSYSSSKTGEAYDGEDIPKLSWATMTRTKAFGTNGSYISGVAPNAVCVSPDNGVLASTYSNGNVALHRYPVPGSKASGKIYQGHCPNVGQLSFSVEGDYLVTLGAQDKCSLLWEVKRPESATRPFPEEVVDATLLHEAQLKASSGDNFVDIKPQGANDVARIFGYNASSFRSNMFYNFKGALVYAAGSYGVVREKSESRMMTCSHDSLITCMALSENKKLAVSATENGNAVVWDTLTGEKLTSFEVNDKDPVRHVAFNPDCSKVAFIDSNSLSVFVSYSGNWTESAGPVRIARSELDDTIPLTFSFPDLDDISLVTGGVGFLRLWTLQGTNLSWNNAIFGENGGLPSSTFASASVNGSVFTGSNEGILNVWYGSECLKSTKAHSTAVIALASLPGTSEKKLVSASATEVKFWNADLVLLQTIQIPAIVHPISAISVDKNVTKLIIADLSSTVTEVLLDTGDFLPIFASVPTSAPIISKAIHPLDADQTLVSYADSSIAMISLSKCSILSSSKLGSPIDMITFSDDGSRIALLNSVEGILTIADNGPLKIQNAIKLPSGGNTTPIFMKFSPDNNALSISLSDERVLLYEVPSFQEIEEVAEDELWASFSKGNSFSLEIGSLTFGSGGTLLIWEN
ncbi:MAG: hypothetical protein CMJ88_14195 [Planctomycetes bacterium]|nr:hypothetical protein [Planctomycetota bacterium]